MKRTLRLWASASACAMIAAACSTISLPSPRAADGTPIRATTTTERPPAADLTDQFGIIVALDDDGAVDIMWVDGTLKDQLAAPDSTRVAPLWSPYNNLVYWARSLGGGNRIIEAVDPDSGTVLSSTEIDNLPFFLAASPNVRQVAHLGLSPAVGVTLGLADFTPPASSTSIGSGEPFFFSCSPDGTRLAQHVGSQGLSILPIGELITTQIETEGSFDWTVPFWIDSQSVLAVHQELDDEQMSTLAIFNVITGERRDLVRVGGEVLFIPNPDRTSIAVQTTEAVSGGAPAVELTAFQDDPGPPDEDAPADEVPPEEPDDELFGALPAVPANELVVVDIETTTITATELGQTLAFAWSPTEDKLAAMTGGDGGATWNFWKDGLIGESPTFLPSELSFTSYLPFFTQMAESQQWWAPDGRTFLFSGQIGDDAGVWVQPVNLGAFPTLVDDGVYGFFAPS